VLFSGSFDHAIDEKGRVSIPARFRDALLREQCESLMITNSFSNGDKPCLQLYTPSEWDRQVIAPAQQKPQFDPAFEEYLLFFIGMAHEVPLDRQGRILIPPKLREHARLERDVTFTARGAYFQLWDKAIFEQVLAAAADKFKDPEFRRKLNL